MTFKANLKPTKLTTALVVAGAIGLAASPAHAKHGRDYRDSRVAYDYARVVNVQPIVETYQVNQPVEQCWDERVPSRGHDRYRKVNRHASSPTNEILGAIIGGVVGNQFGSGRGKKVATAAGAVLGASVAHDIERNSKSRDRYDRYGRNSHRGYDRYEVVQRCEIRDNYTTQEQVVGYNVAYKYRGEVFHTEMDRHPGKKIRVRLTVDPA